MKQLRLGAASVAVFALIALPAHGGTVPIKLAGTVGPGFTITLTKGGKAVKTLKAGLYKLAVADRSAAHNFHLVGPGVNKRTGVGFRGTVKWRVRLQKGKVYRFVCDPHASSMKGSFRVT